MGAGTWRVTAEEPAAQGTHPQTAYPRLMPTEPIPARAPCGSFACHLEREDTRPPLLLAHRARATHGIQWRNRFVGGESRRMRRRRAELLQYCRPSIKDTDIPSWKTIRKYILELAGQAQDTLVKEFQVLINCASLGRSNIYLYRKLCPCSVCRTTHGPPSRVTHI